MCLCLDCLVCVLQLAILQLALDIAHGMSYIHAANVIHGGKLPHYFYVSFAATGTQGRSSQGGLIRTLTLLAMKAVTGRCKASSKHVTLHQSQWAHPCSLTVVCTVCADVCVRVCRRALCCLGTCRPKQWQRHAPIRAATDMLHAGQSGRLWFESVSGGSRPHTHLQRAAGHALLHRA